MKALLPMVLIIGALVGWFAPGATDADGEPTPPRVTGSPEGARQATARPAWYGGAMVLPRAGDGHFYAQARIDTRDYRMLVDTGASVVALTGEDARNIGLDWDPNALAPVAHGASGPVLGVPVVLDSIAVAISRHAASRRSSCPRGCRCRCSASRSSRMSRKWRSPGTS